MHIKINLKKQVGRAFMEDVSINLWPPHKYTQIKNKDHEVAQRAKVPTTNSELSSVHASLK